GLPRPHRTVSVSTTTESFRQAIYTENLTRSGVAPIPAWSGASAGQMRLSRAGNRQLNAAIHRIALTQIRMTGSLGQIYFQKLIETGKTKRAALRCVKRRIARRVYQALRRDAHDHQNPVKPPQSVAA
nr:transposase [Streptomyces sp. DSM 41633]